MQLRHLRYFVKIVEAGSFSRAAGMIHIAQPALSRQIAELEETLGVSLLHRSARGVRPTPAGEALYREAASILQKIEQLPGIVRSSGGETAGVVSLGMSSTLAACLAGPFMEACRRAYPRVALRFITGDSVLLQSRIEARTLDIGIVFEDEPVPGFVRRPLFRQRLYLVLREPPVNSATCVSLAELTGRPLVLPTQSNVTRQLLNRTFAAAGVVPNIAAEVDVLSSMLSAVQTGIGDAILPKGDFSDVPGYADIISLPIEPPVHLTASIVSSRDAALTAAGSAVRDLFVNFVENLLADVPPPGAEWIGSGAAITDTHTRMPT